MAVDELLQRIQQSRQMGQREEQKAEEEKYVKFIIISINEKRYALLASEVREILTDTPIHYVPFVPPYVRGFINRHGEPYTVIDPNILFEKEKTSAETFLVLNLPEDQLVFIISDIHAITKVKEQDIYPITAEGETAGFLRGSISHENRDVFIINPETVLKRLSDDLAAG